MQMVAETAGRGRKQLAGSAENGIKVLEEGPDN
jgi:hypothetical protein